MNFLNQIYCIQSENPAVEIERSTLTEFTSNDNSSKCTTIGRLENVKEEAESKLERERRLIEKEGEELRTREKEVAEKWMLNEESKEASAGSASSADRWMLKEQSKEEASAGSASSRSRLRIRAILEKQAKQREEDEKVRQQKSESQDDMSKFLWAFKMK